MWMKQTYKAHILHQIKANINEKSDACILMKSFFLLLPTRAKTLTIFFFPTSPRRFLCLANTIFSPASPPLLSLAWARVSVSRRFIHDVLFYFRTLRFSVSLSAFVFPCLSLSLSLSLSLCLSFYSCFPNAISFWKHTGISTCLGTSILIPVTMYLVSFNKPSSSPSASNRFTKGTTQLCCQILGLFGQPPRNRTIAWSSGASV